MFRDELKYIYNFLTVIKKHFPSYSQIYTVAKWLKNYLQTRQSFEQVSYNSKHERETWLEEGARSWAGGHGSSTAAPAAGDAPTAGVGSTASGLGGWRKALAVSEAEHQQSFYLWCVCACLTRLKNALGYAKTTEIGRSNERSRALPAPSLLHPKSFLAEHGPFSSFHKQDPLDIPRAEHR